MQRTAEGVGRLWGGPPTDIVEEGTCPRPHALVYGPSVIPVIERALIVFSLLVVSGSSDRSRSGRRACVASALGRFGVTSLWSYAHVPSCRTVAALSVFVLCVTCSGRQRGRDPLAVCSLVMAIFTSSPIQSVVRPLSVSPDGPISLIPSPSHVYPLAKTFSHLTSTRSTYPWHSSHSFY